MAPSCQPADVRDLAVVIIEAWRGDAVRLLLELIGDEGVS
jgi:hypothetical protein